MLWLSVNYEKFWVAVALQVMVLVVSLSMAACLKVKSCILLLQHCHFAVLL